MSTPVVGSRAVVLAFADLRRAVADHRRATQDAAAAARLLTLACERERATREAVEQARSVLVWAVAVDPGGSSTGCGLP